MYTIEQLEAAGGSLWEKYGKKRVYFDPVKNLESFEYTTYNTGNISSASLDGDKISNTKAKELLSVLQDMKFWYEVEGGKFKARKYLPYRSRLIEFEEIVQKIEEEIVRKIEEKEGRR